MPSQTPGNNLEVKEISLFEQLSADEQNFVNNCLGDMYTEAGLKRVIQRLFPNTSSDDVLWLTGRIQNIQGWNRVQEPDSEGRLVEIDIRRKSVAELILQIKGVMPLRAEALLEKRKDVGLQTREKTKAVIETQKEESEEDARLRDDAFMVTALMLDPNFGSEMILKAFAPKESEQDARYLFDTQAMNDLNAIGRAYSSGLGKGIATRYNVSPWQEVAAILKRSKKQ